jgi:hypothetical protein
LNGIALTSGAYLLNQTFSYTSLASGDPFFGQTIGTALIGKTATQVLFDHVRFTSQTNSYTAWIAGFASVGT